MQCKRCDGFGEWERYEPETDGFETVSCPDCKGAGVIGGDMDKTFGEFLQDARRGQGVTLRGLAVRVGCTPSYLCDIEKDRRVPAEDVLENLADALSLELDEVMARSGRFGVKVERYIKRHPDSIRLLQKCCELGLSSDELLALETYAARLVVDGRKPPKESE